MFSCKKLCMEIGMNVSDRVNVSLDWRLYQGR